MLDALVAMTDIVTNLWSMGVHGPVEREIHAIIDTFPASDGFVVLQLGRLHQFRTLAEVVGHPEWLEDPRLADQPGWVTHFDDVVRPGLEAWAATRTRGEAADELGRAGIAAGPCLRPPEVIDDPHVAARAMLVEVPRTDDVDEAVLVPGNPVKIAGVADGPESRVPWLGEHTDDVLGAELGLSADELAALRSDGTIG
jgi:crotonobetainyl-CoA:carnitine CoA-transferase CaiB-like acyl-CoA transferase